MKRIACGLTALLLLLSVCVGCNSSDDRTTGDDASETSQSLPAELAGIDPMETVLTMNGREIPADIYLYWLMSTCGNLEYQLQMFSMYYGMYVETLDEKGNVLWDQSVEGTPLADMAREEAVDTALSYALLESVAEKNGVAFTDEDQADLDEAIAAQMEEAGGEEAFRQGLYEQGLTLSSYKRMAADSYLYEHLLDMARDPSSRIYQAPGDDNAYVDHILLMTTDSETGEPLSVEEAAEKKEQAEDLLAQLEASDNLEALFTEFADTYGEDPGRAADVGYLINPETNFVQEFKDAAFALKPGEISGIVESDYGYHILLRKELTIWQLETLSEEALSSYLDGQMELGMADVTRSEKLDGLDVGEIYAGYNDKLQELHPETTEDAEGSGGSEGDEGAGAGEVE